MMMRDNDDADDNELAGRNKKESDKGEEVMQANQELTREWRKRSSKLPDLDLELLECKEYNNGDW